MQGAEYPIAWESSFLKGSPKNGLVYFAGAASQNGRTWTEPPCSKIGQPLATSPAAFLEGIRARVEPPPLQNFRIMVTRRVHIRNRQFEHL